MNAQVFTSFDSASNWLWSKIPNDGEYDFDAIECEAMDYDPIQDIITCDLDDEELHDAFRRYKLSDKVTEPAKA
jgi:hypothetical protein